MLFSQRWNNFILIFSSLSDENALRAKVQEALSVYDEYLKNKGEPDESTKQGVNGDADAEKNE